MLASKSYKSLYFHPWRPWKSPKRKLLGFPNHGGAGRWIVFRRCSCTCYVYIYILKYYCCFPVGVCKLLKKICASPMDHFPKFQAKIYTVFNHHLVEFQTLQLLSNPSLDVECLQVSLCLLTSWNLARSALGGSLHLTNSVPTTKWFLLSPNRCNNFLKEM